MILLRKGREDEAKEVKQKCCQQNSIMPVPFPQT
jgi:hypothetical protein